MKKNDLKIEFYGHSFFKISSGENSVVFDPVGEETGYSFEQPIDSNLMLISHEHFDHANREIIRIEEKENLEKNIEVKQIKAFHDEEHGKRRGENSIHVVKINDFKVCHLGDLGHVLDQKQIDEIGNIDVLMIPIGGTFTIDSVKASIVARSINTKIIIPMHYMTDKLKFELEPVDNFIANVNDDYEIKEIKDYKVFFEKEELEIKKQKEVYILDIKR